jgi:hypothetical protein
VLATQALVYRLAKDMRILIPDLGQRGGAGKIRKG